MKEEKGVSGIVYLIHFNEPLAHSSHYIGWASNFKGRIWHHQHGTGARILSAANEKGIEWNVVRVWVNEDRHFERWLKNKKGANKFCPVCTEECSLNTAIKQVRVDSEEWVA